MSTDLYSRAPKVADCSWEVIFTGKGLNPGDWVTCEKATGHKDYPQLHSLEFYRIKGVDRGKAFKKRFYGENAWADSRRVCADINFGAWSAEGWE